MGVGKPPLLYVGREWKSKVQISTVLGIAVFEKRGKHVGVAKLGPLVGRY